MAQVIEIESRDRDVIEIGIRSVDVVEIGYRGGGVPWGNITGFLKDQADLAAVLEELRILAYAGL